MADDTEVLDWGHDEEDGVALPPGEHKTFPEDDVEDAVSLGGDEEDEFLTYQSRVPQRTSNRNSSPPKTVRQPRQDHQKNHPESQADLHRTPKHRTPQEQHNESTEQASLHGRTFGNLVHALPPKPVVSGLPFVHPSHPSIVEATAMASRLDRDKRNGGASKTAAPDYLDPLPPGWEVRYPRSGRGVYYYNILTEQSTWTRPAAPSREMRRRDDPLDTSLPGRRDEPMALARIGRADSADMSYDDRHYRPAESGRREERSAPSTQLIDSYIPGSYSPNPRNSRSSPPPPRTRDNEHAQPPRRPPSPLGDRDGPQGSHREAPPLAPTLSAKDRTWVANDIVPLDRPKERKQLDHPAPPETERRNLPRDTDRSSTLRPRSPVSHSRDFHEPASVPPAPIKPSQSISEMPLAGRQSHFSHVDAPDEFNHRQPEPRDGGMRRTRTDDTVTHGASYPDDIPNARTRSDVRRDDDTLPPPADVQRSGSRKRTPLPPQDEAFRPNARSAPAQRDGGYLSAPMGPAASLRESRNSRPASVDRPRRRSPSPPPPQADYSTTDRVDRDRDHARSRRSKSSANGRGVESDVAHEHGHDVTMDIDDAPPPRSSDPPPKHNLPRRPVQQDEAPRFPRAMLPAENEGLSRSTPAPREPRDTADSRHRSSVDEPSRSSHGRERQTTERHSIDQHLTPKQPSRAIEARPPPPSGSTPRLSGTNSTPIGTRNKYAGDPPTPPAPPVQPSGNRRRGAAVSGSNTEPVGARQSRSGKDYERPPHLDPGVAERTTERGGRREDARPSPPSNLRASSPMEPTALPTRPSRALLGTSRFGPPVAKDSTDPVRPKRNISLESIVSEPLPPEGALRAVTPPPPSRESSMESTHETHSTLPARPAHLPPRPETPPRGYQHRSEEENRQQHHRRKVASPIVERRGHDVEASSRQRPSSPTVPRKRTMDTYVSEPVPAPRDAREGGSRVNHRDVDVHVPSAPVPVVRDEDRVRAPLIMHPERALMLQVNGLPPRPPSALSRPRTGRSSRRDRREDRERAEPLRGHGGGGGGGGGFTSVSPSGGDRQRYPDPLDERGDRGMSGGGGGGGGSLLDRLTSPMLRDRVQLPLKRDREEMLLGGSGEVIVNPDVEEHDGSKRARRRAGGGGGGGGGGTKARKGRR